jgi:hypothetical protein
MRIGEATLNTTAMPVKLESTICLMITKDFLLAKEIRAMRTKILRRNKIFRDHRVISACVAKRARVMLRKGRAGEGCRLLGRNARRDLAGNRAAPARMTAAVVPAML